MWRVWFGYQRNSLQNEILNSVAKALKDAQVVVRGSWLSIK